MESIQLENDLICIYFVLSKTNTIPSKLIHLFTKDEYCHLSISMNKYLNKMYSFGRKGVYNLFNAGFITEDIKSGLFQRMSKTKIAVFEYSVSLNQYHLINKTLVDYLNNKDNLYFNHLDIWLMIFGGREIELTDTFFCTQFVTHLLNQCEITLFDKSACKVRPQEYYGIGKLIYEGLASEYVFYDVPNRGMICQDQRHMISFTNR